MANLRLQIAARVGSKGCRSGLLKLHVAQAAAVDCCAGDMQWRLEGTVCLQTLQQGLQVTHLELKVLL